MKKFSFARDTLLPKDFFGLDSIQGLLEMAMTYDKEDIGFGFNSNHPIYTYLCQLEKEGYIHTEWSPYNDDPKTKALDQISLTIAGHKLLEEIKNKSRTGKIKKRIIDLIWIIITTIITTLIVLYFKGN